MEHTLSEGFQLPPPAAPTVNRLQGFLAAFGVVTGPVKGLSAGFGAGMTPCVVTLGAWAAGPPGLPPITTVRRAGSNRRLATRFTSARVTAWIRELRRAT